MQINLNTIFKLLATLLIISMIVLFSSCDIQKTASKTKTDFSYKDNFENYSFRPGDSVSFRPSGVVYRDTTIYRVTKNNMRLETVYDSNGNIRDINCYAAQIEELTRRNSALEQLVKQKYSTKTENFNPTFILYIVGGVVVIFLFGLLLIFFYVKSQTATTNALLQNVIK
ncbi:MAG: hypothetical protein RLZZ540_278 [Bacteroidota bacterium]|jgi:ATP-dependent Zn protease